jgi:sugar (pentulose or hexulose) kinase
MGFESRTPYTNDAALAANITNEGGAEGRYRVLKNIMGLWLLQRIKRAPDFRPANAYQPNASAAGLSIPDKPERRPLYQPRRYECRNSGSMP